MFTRKTIDFTRKTFGFTRKTLDFTRKTFDFTRKTFDFTRKTVINDTNGLPYTYSMHGGKQEVDSGYVQERAQRAHRVHSCDRMT